jgi:hypothetical protein
MNTALKKIRRINGGPAKQPRCCAAHRGFLEPEAVCLYTEKLVLDYYVGIVSDYVTMTAGQDAGVAHKTFVVSSSSSSSSSSSF